MRIFASLTDGRGSANCGNCANLRTPMKMGKELVIGSQVTNCGNCANLERNADSSACIVRLTKSGPLQVELLQS
jgi:hypothetical protein